MLEELKPIYDLSMILKPLLFIVDDEPDFCLFLMDLFREQFRVLSAGSFREVFQLLDQNTPDAILVDVNMPGESGIKLCRELRSRLNKPQVPILMISAQDEPDARIQSFEAGADDFIAKPFRPDELFMRLSSRMKRLREMESGTHNVIEAGRLRLDLDRVEARVSTDRISLGPVEFKILCLLVRGLGQLRSRNEIENFVWGENPPASRALDPHINAIRKKLKGSELELRTVYGAGYSLRLKSPAYG